MSFRAVKPARIDFSDPQAPRSIAEGDIYGPRDEAEALAHHVYLRGNALPQRWVAKPRFVILDTRFGLGDNFLATWAAWRYDPQRCDQLWYIAIEAHPPRGVDLTRAHCGTTLAPLAAELRAQWPVSAPDMHMLDLDQGRVRLLLVWAALAPALSEITAQIDAFYLSGFGRRASLWDDSALRRLHRLAAPQATLAADQLAPDVRDWLTTAGFRLSQAPGLDGQGDMTVGNFAPRHSPVMPVGRQAAASLGAEGAVIIGAGLAGAAVAQALARQGVRSTVLDRHPLPAQEASGNAAGLYHGIVHRLDGTHSRWLRAAALWAQRSYAPWVADGRVDGQTTGLLRGEQALPLAAMRKLIADQALPLDWVQALGPARAGRRSGTAWTGPAWLYPSGGWIAPGQWVQHALQHPLIGWRGGVAVHRLQATGEGWRLFDAAGVELARAGVVVLANAADAVRLLGTQPGRWHRSRGQVSLWPNPSISLPMPLADGSYALSLGDGRCLFGSTRHVSDDDPAVRQADHDDNCAALRRLTGIDIPADTALEGRVAWRLQTADRLPWVGPIPTHQVSDSGRHDQPRLFERQPGLYILAGLGSRGITHAPLAGELLASWITGAPMPAPASLIDALDVARFAVRAARRQRRED